MYVTLVPITMREVVKVGRDPEFGPKRRNALAFSVKPVGLERIELGTGEIFSRLASADKEIRADLHVIERDGDAARDEDVMHYWERRPGSDLQDPSPSKITFHVSIEGDGYRSLCAKIASRIYPSRISVDLDVDRSGDGAVTYAGDPYGDMKKWRNVDNPSVPITGATIVFDVLEERQEDQEPGRQVGAAHDPAAAAHDLLEALKRVEGLLRACRLPLLLLAGAAAMSAIRLWF